MRVARETRALQTDSMKITTKAPCRVDLAGGTLDIWPLYLFHKDAVTVNFAVDRYTRCTLETREDSEIHVSSSDLNAKDKFESLEAARSAKKPKLSLVAEVLKFFTPATHDWAGVWPSKSLMRSSVAGSSVRLWPFRRSTIRTYVRSMMSVPIIC